jgi:hypothetical protein
LNYAIHSVWRTLGETTPATAKSITLISRFVVYNSLLEGSGRIFLFREMDGEVLMIASTRGLVEGYFKARKDYA